ncbi:MAG: PEP-CTERM sorting domain-containing protein [Verrucomicrobiota bacterium]|jgi:hypothetical protein
MKKQIRNFALSHCLSEMKKGVLSLVLVALTLALQPARASDVSLTVNESFSGNVSYDNSWTDWVVFAPTNNNSNPVRLVGGGNLISDISADGTLQPVSNPTITTSWSSGTPLASGANDSGLQAGIVGYMYSGATPCTYMSFSVISPSPDYTIDVYLDDWGLTTDLQLSNGGTTNTYSSFLTWINYQHLEIAVSGSEVGSDTTVMFTNFRDDDAWGQFDLYSAAVMGPVPEPSTLALAGLGGLSLLLFHRRQNRRYSEPSTQQKTNENKPS